MNGPDIISIYRNQLGRHIAERDGVPELRPLVTTQWIAMSALQKAIRRGREELERYSRPRAVTDRLRGRVPTVRVGRA
jgi:hypothetical protein